MSKPHKQSSKSTSSAKAPPTASSKAAAAFVARNGAPAGPSVPPLLTALDKKLVLLLDPRVTVEKRGEIEQALLAELDDPPHLIRSPILPPDHALVTQARIIWEAMGQVVQGKTDETIVAPLASVPRKSPWAPYVLAIRAIQAVYRSETELAIRLAASVDPRSPASRLARGVSVLCGENPPHISKGMRRFMALANGASSVKAALGRLDDAFKLASDKRVSWAVRGFCDGYRWTHPRLLRLVLDEVAHRWFELHFDSECLLEALGFDPKSPEWTRLGALAFDNYKLEVSCDYWMRFQLGDKTLTARERAMVLSHIATRVSDDPDFCSACGVVHEKLDSQQSVMAMLARAADGLKQDKKEILDRIAKLARGETRNALAELLPYVQELVEEFGTDRFKSQTLLEQASRLYADPSYFAKMVELEQNSGTSDRTRLEKILLEWSLAVPTDTRPVLQLAKLSRKRAATRKALDFIEKARAIDPLDPDIQLQMLLMQFESAIRRLKQRHLHLVQQDTDALQRHHGSHHQLALTLAAALLEVKRILESRVAVVRWAEIDPRKYLMNSELVAFFLLADILHMIESEKRSPVHLESPPNHGPEEIAKALVTFLPLAELLEYGSVAVVKFLIKLETQLLDRATLEISGLECEQLAEAAQIDGRTALALRLLELGITACNGRITARWLLVRGKLRFGTHWDVNAARCMRAAYTLANRSGDKHVLRWISYEAKARAHSQHSNPLRAYHSQSAFTKVLEDAELEDVLRQEQADAEASQARLLRVPKKVSVQLPLTLGYS